MARFWYSLNRIARCNIQQTRKHMKTLSNCPNGVDSIIGILAKFEFLSWRVSRHHFALGCLMIGLQNDETHRTFVLLE